MGIMPPAATLSDIEQKNLLEEVDRLLPVQKGLVPTKVLIGMLRVSMILKASSTCVSNLEKRVGMQLDQASLEDLLLPNYSYTMETLYNVECMRRILEHFLAMDQANGGASPCMDDMMASPSIIPITAVARLLDGYLAEIAPDVNLKPPKFQALASAVPEYARPLDDGLYRAIDVYLKVRSVILLFVEFYRGALIVCNKKNVSILLNIDLYLQLHEMCTTCLCSCLTAQFCVSHRHIPGCQKLNGSSYAG
jgi:APA family basic amino acid/polyamine antiporter